MTKLSHFDDAGEARMMDVSGKPATRREAEASVLVAMSPGALAALPQNPKGNPLAVARIAGIQAAKRTAELIPMCHPLPLSFVDVQVEVVDRRRRDSRHRGHYRRDRRGDGGDDSGSGRRADRLRHVQGGRQRAS